eukprot:6147207-Amphidinium_carterae.1
MAGNSIHSAVAGALTMWVLLVYMPGPAPVAQLGKKRVDLTGHCASSSTGKRHCHVKMPSVSLVHDSDSASSAGEPGVPEHFHCRASRAAASAEENARARAERFMRMFCKFLSRSSVTSHGVTPPLEALFLPNTLHDAVMIDLIPAEGSSESSPRRGNAGAAVPRI